MPITITYDGENYTIGDELALKLAKQGKLTREQVAPLLERLGRSPGIYPADPHARRGKDPSEPVPEFKTLVDKAKTLSQMTLDATNAGLRKLTPSEMPPMSEFGPLGPPEPVTAPQLSPSAARFMVELLGGIGGGALGPLVTAGRIPRIASALGEALGQGGASLAAESVDPTANPAETAVNTAVGGGLMRGANEATVLGLRGASGTKVNPEMLKASNELQAMGGPGLSAGQISNSAIIDTMEGLAESSLFGGPRMAANKAANVGVVQEQLAKMVQGLGEKGPEFIGKALADAAEGGRGAWLGVSNAMYKKVEQLAPNAKVYLSGDVLKRARDLADEARVLAPSVSVVPGEIERIIEKYTPPALKPPTPSGLLDQFGKPFSVKSLPPPAPVFVSMEDARALRSDLLSFHRGAEGDVKATALEKASGEVATLVDGQITKGFMQSSPSGDAHAAFREASAFFKGGTERFDKDLIAAIAKKDPEVLYRYAVQNNKPTQIRQLKEAVTMRDTTSGRTLDPDGLKVWQHVQGRVLSDVLLAGSARENVMGKSAADFLQSGGNVKIGEAASKLNTIGNEALDQIFTPQQVKIVRRNLDLINKATDVGRKRTPFAVALSLKQAGAVSEAAGTIGLAFGGSGKTMSIGSTVLLAGPRVVANLFTSPKFRNWLTIGNRARPGSELAGRAISRLTELAIVNGAVPMDTQPQAQRSPQRSLTLSGPRGREATQ